MFLDADRVTADGLVVNSQAHDSSVDCHTSVVNKLDR